MLCIATLGQLPSRIRCFGTPDPRHMPGSSCPCCCASRDWCLARMPFERKARGFWTAPCAMTTTPSTSPARGHSERRRRRAPPERHVRPRRHGVGRSGAAAERRKAPLADLPDARSIGHDPSGAGCAVPAATLVYSQGLAPTAGRAGVPPTVNKRIRLRPMLPRPADATRSARNATRRSRRGERPATETVKQDPCAAFTASCRRWPLCPRAATSA